MDSEDSSNTSNSDIRDLEEERHQNSSSQALLQASQQLSILNQAASNPQVQAALLAAQQEGNTNLFNEIVQEAQKNGLLINAKP